MNALLEFDDNFGVVMNENQRRKKHRKLGLCETCSNRLYNIKSNKRIPLIKKRQPVTNQHVLNGRCLHCDPLPSSRTKEERNSNMIHFRHSLQNHTDDDTPKTHKRHNTIHCISPLETLDRSNVTKTLKEDIACTKHFQEPMPSSRNKREHNSNQHSMQEDIPHHDTSKNHKRHNTIHSISPLETPDRSNVTKRLETNFSNNKKYQNEKDFCDETGISQTFSSVDDRQKTGNSKNNRHHQRSCRPETSDLSNVEHADLEQIITEMLSDSLTLTKKIRLCKDLLSFTKNNYHKVEMIMSGGIMIIHNMMIGEHSSNENLQSYTLSLYETLLPIADERVLDDIPIVETITQLMVLHQTSLEVQRRAIHCLRHLADRNQRFKLSIAYSGAVDILNSVMNQFSSTDIITREGRTLIANLLQ